MNQFEAVIFDIDGTLSPEISWLALTRDLGASVEEHKAIHKKFVANEITYPESKAMLLRLWHATGNANKGFFENVFRSWSFREGAEELLQYLHSKNYSTCLITGAVDLYAQIVAERLGIEFFFANTELMWNDNDDLVDFNYVRDQGERKVEHYLQFCKENNIDPKKCVVVGDDENDIRLFELTKRGVLFESGLTHSLDDIAWKKVNHLSALKTIL